jgi:hypothetical protein
MDYNFLPKRIPNHLLLLHVSFLLFLQLINVEYSRTRANKWDKIYLWAIWTPYFGSRQLNHAYLALCKSVAKTSCRFIFQPLPTCLLPLEVWKSPSQLPLHKNPTRFLSLSQHSHFHLATVFCSFNWFAVAMRRIGDPACLFIQLRDIPSHSLRSTDSIYYIEKK